MDDHKRRVKSIELTVNGTGLNFDRDYGMDRRTGWTAVADGCVLNPQFVPLHRAIVALVRDILQQSEATDG